MCYNMYMYLTENTALWTQSNWMYVEHVEQKASNNNKDSNSKFSNKEIIWFKLWITIIFYLSSLKTSIYSYFELRQAWNVFDLVGLWIKPCSD